MDFIRKLILPLALTATIFGCKPEPVFPIEPSITFKEYIKSTVSDSLQVVFSFTDGDGDIGLSSTDADSNMVLTLYHTNPAGQSVVSLNGLTSDPLDSIIYVYRVPRLTASQKGLEGDIYLTIHSAFIPYDTIQFNAFLLDQAGHKSNLVRTDELILH